MKVQDLFESRINHGNVVRAVIRLALQHLVANPKIKQDAAEQIRDSDQFWSSYIDEVTSELQRFIEGRIEGYETMLDAMANALDEVGQNMVEFYKDKNNHAPGADFGKSGLDLHSLHATPDKLLQTKDRNLLSFDVESIDDNVMLDALAAAAPERIQELADLLIKKWPLAFTDKEALKMKKKPLLWDDWFTHAQINAFKTGADVEKALKEVDKLNWVLDTGKGFPKNYDLFTHIIGVPALRKKLVSLIPQMQV